MVAMSYRRIFFSTIVGLALSAQSVDAQELRYLFQAKGSGTFGGLNFVDQLFRIAIYADPADVGVYDYSGAWIIRGITNATVDVDGVGSAQVAEPLFLFDNPAGSVGFGVDDMTLSDIYSFGGVPFQTYDLRSEIIAEGVSAGGGMQPVPTMAGVFTLNGVGTNPYFEASRVVATPEPPTMYMAGSALFMLLGFVLRRRWIDSTAVPERCLETLET